MTSLLAREINTQHTSGMYAPLSYGEPHELTRLDRSGNLAAPIDFRPLCATVLEDWPGVDPEAVLGEQHPTLLLFA
jgi:hypothetical protein